MFTGKLSNISRAEAKSLTEENSGKILSNVSKKLDYLINHCRDQYPFFYQGL